MASLSDLSSVYNTQAPAGFNLANLAVAGSLTKAQGDLARTRLLRNFGQFDLPGLLSSQAARGAFGSSATRRKVQQIATGAADTLGDIAFGSGSSQAQNGANALLTGTGFQF